MKYYKYHNHKEDNGNNQDLKRKSISILDLAQLWINNRGKSPLFELSLKKKVRNKFFIILKEYFESQNDKKKADLIKKVGLMS